MRDIRLQTAAALLCLFCATVALAQQSQPTAAVPKLVRFSGSFRPADATPAQSMESVTLSVYRDQTGGNALWHEIQNVVVDTDGHYSLLMGATQNEGMPLDLFSSGEPRWLGAQFNRPGEAEQPRVLLVSVPYALKASDAETLGGRPASAYLLAGAPVGTDAAHESSIGTPVSSASATTTTPLASINPKALHPGTPNFIAKFDNTGTATLNSVMFQDPTSGNVGVSTTAPGISLDVRTGSLPQMGIAGTTDYLTFFASDVFGPAIYWDPAKDMRFGKGGSGLYNPFGFVEQMRIQSSTGNVGIGTQAPGSKLDVAGDINFSGSVRYQGVPLLQVPGGMSRNNVALGLGALAINTSGISNTASGFQALASNTTGSGNTASGFQALASNTTGSGNTASAFQALVSNTTGSYNTASTAGALASNTTGSYNTASGYIALSSNSVGTNNTAIGNSALGRNTSGNYNTAIGDEVLLSNTAGSYNTAIGNSTLVENTTGNYNIAIGTNAATSVSGGNSNNIHIGNIGSSGDNGTVRIGGTQTSFFVAGVRGITTANNDAIPVMIDSAGQLGTVSSSRRFKEDISDMGAASHDLMRLRPVTYRYKQPFADGSKPIQYGLIAEEVAEVYPDLVAHSADGQIETVKYQVLDSMLLNEAQRQQAEIRRLEQQINEQHQEINEQRQQNQSLQERLAKLEAALVSMSGVTKVSSAQ